MEGAIRANLCLFMKKAILPSTGCAFEKAMLSGIYDNDGSSSAEITPPADGKSLQCLFELIHGSSDHMGLYAWPSSHETLEGDLGLNI